MRYNIFVQQNGATYGALLCSVCNKNVTFELERQTEMSKYGEGSRVLSILGAPKPPNVVRRKAAGDASLDDTV